jgi:catechol 2,3-dioxygenase-like lactoylglutathione lyase family enzyme
METTIAKLLHDFESGRITRRQLIQSLSMAALAAPFATMGVHGGPSAPIAPTPAPLKTVWLDHISYAVSDYKRSSDFYQQVMGWTVKPGSDTGRQVWLEIGDIGGIIIRNGGQGSAAPAPAAPPPAAGRADSAGAPPARPARAPITGVVNHISYGVEPWNMDSVRAHLSSHGLKPTEDKGSFSGPMAQAPFQSFHVKDPDGWDLQISNQNKEHHEGAP